MNLKLEKIPLYLGLILLFGLIRLLVGDSLDLGFFTARTPWGWNARPAENAYVIFDPDKTISLVVTYTEYKYPNLSVMAERLGVDYSVKAVDESSGFLFFNDQDYRLWRGLTMEGHCLEISVHGSHKKLAKVLKKFKLSSKIQEDAELAPQLQSLLDNLKKREVLDWLTGNAPLFADRSALGPEPGAQGGEPEAAIPWRGEPNLSAEVPAGWSISTQDDQTRFSSPDNKEYLSLIALPSLKAADFDDDFVRYQADCVAEARKIGAVNIRTAESTVSFDLPNLSEGEILHIDDNSFILIRQGGSPQLDSLHWSLLE